MLALDKRHRLTTNDAEALNQFYLVLGEHKGQVYALVQVLDDQMIYRDNDILRLDLSDHIRVTYTDQAGQTQQLVITATEEGITTAYRVDRNWRYALDGEADNRVPGVLLKTENGYALEFRIPLELLGPTRNFGLAVVDVDNDSTRAIESITGTLPSGEREAFGLVLLKTPEVLRIIEGLGYSGANIQVIDSQSRIRAEVGSYHSDDTMPEERIEPRRLWAHRDQRLAIRPILHFGRADAEHNPHRPRGQYHYSSACRRANRCLFYFAHGR